MKSLKAEELELQVYISAADAALNGAALLECVNHPAP
jgi:hypothetical protein